MGLEDICMYSIDMKVLCVPYQPIRLLVHTHSYLFTDSLLILLFWQGSSPTPAHRLSSKSTDNEAHILRVPVAMAITKLLLHLPQSSLTAHLPGLVAAHTHTHTHTHTLVQGHTDAHLYICAHTHIMLLNTHMHMHTHTHTHIYALEHTHTHAHPLTH